MICAICLIITVTSCTQNDQPVGELQNKAQAEWEKLLQDENIAAYRQACIDHYDQFDIDIPSNLDPCMYSLYLDELLSYNLYCSYVDEEAAILDSNQELTVLNASTDAPDRYSFLDRTVCAQLESIYYDLYGVDIPARIQNLYPGA